MTDLKIIQRHPFHLVDVSPWPLLAGQSALALTTGFVMYLQCYQGGGYVFIFGLITLVFVSFLWWRDIVREATYQGHHTKAVQAGLRWGMILFIVSEIMFFFAFFWAFFAASLSPTQEIGGVWPPPGIDVLNPWEVPFLNTVILLLSGVTCTWAHHAIIQGDRAAVNLSLTLTVALGAVFTFLQGVEYYEANFTISDGIYGSTFFLATGFHGFHVLIGSTFLVVCLIRSLNYHFTRQHHFGFEAAAWYWHFVDVVWLFLFVSVYWWGGV
uniref:Cytochrome c oxidase subunit 3 n=1 Tax=Proteomonas sulcata TaxID=77928 RepID=A0A2P1G8B4_9CRYP|nr:cytochrome c oxidase subunit 3 [Proteomonas sulcata]AVM81190.1 cytochrome c oxidase subunit 3 [Proteomonas sulcata]